MEYVVGDVTSEEDVELLFRVTLQRFGRVDVLIANAAIYPKQKFLQMSHSEWAKVIEINLIGASLCCRKAIPIMLEKGYGRIILLGSFAAQAIAPDSSAYSVSKAGLRLLNKALAKEIDSKLYPNVLVNELVPGAVRTQMSSKGDNPEEVYPHVKFLATLPAGSPTGRIFIKNKLYEEDYGLKARFKRFLGRLANL